MILNLKISLLFFASRVEKICVHFQASVSLSSPVGLFPFVQILNQISMEFSSAQRISTNTFHDEIQTLS